MPELAAIFDMDGVLVDSYEAHFKSWLQLYGELGLAYTEADFAADFGRTSRDILFRRFGSQLTDERIRDLDERKEALFRDELHKHFQAMDGGAELIDALAENGFRLGVGSSAPPENIVLCLDKLAAAPSLPPWLRARTCRAASLIRRYFCWRPNGSESRRIIARSSKTPSMVSKRQIVRE